MTTTVIRLEAYPVLGVRSMNLNRSSERTGKRRQQFSIRTLLILTTIVGPVLGWYGPAAVDKLRDFFADEPVAVQVANPQIQQLLAKSKLEYQKARNRAKQRIREKVAKLVQKVEPRSEMEQIELGMQADLWERGLQGVGSLGSQR